MTSSFSHYLKDSEDGIFYLDEPSDKFFDYFIKARALSSGFANKLIHYEDLFFRSNIFVEILVVILLFINLCILS
jgi:hypothetical protein